MRWEGGKGGKVMRWQGRKGGRMVRCMVMVMVMGRNGNGNGKVGGSWSYSRVGNTGRVQDFYFFVSDVNQGNKGAV